MRDYWLNICHFAYVQNGLVFTYLCISDTIIDMGIATLVVTVIALVAIQ